MDGQDEAYLAAHPELVSRGVTPLAHWASAAVAVADGRCHVTLDLRAAENARSAAASILLQRLLRAVPSAMPAQHLCASAFDVVARSECVECRRPRSRSTKQLIRGE